MADVSKNWSSLADTGLETRRRFEQVRAIDSPVEFAGCGGWPNALFAAEADRFELWAVNMGLFVRGHGSLDYRVREAESLASTLRRFMTDINDSLDEGCSPTPTALLILC
jgi:hypothetical protein